MKCKLSPEEFWRLTWFEFRLYIDRATDELKQRKELDEAEWERTRIIWAVLMNTSFKKTGGGKFAPEDLIKLSHDKEQPVAEKPTLETFERLVQKHGKRKRKNGK